MSFELLRLIASVADGDLAESLPENAIRFALQYPDEPVLEEERERLENLLESPNFNLVPLDPDLKNFLVFQFPNVERRIAPDRLYAAADALVDELGLVSAEPDIPSVFVLPPEDLAAPESIGDRILSLTCWAKEDDTLNKKWAIKTIRADKAWAKAKGAGIIVAQPDTGITKHVELDGMLDLAKAWNTLDGNNDPTDPLSSKVKNPGHGTATSSVVASREAGQILGAAPQAKVVPIRCINNVVIGWNATPLARAILHAVRIRADVISMSLGGGIHSNAVVAALEKAAQAGIIIISAGGNCVQPIVVFPANTRNAIALGGVNVAERPWKGSSRGKRIDVSAPAENVWVASRRAPGDATNGIKPSQGTSFAAALTAGAAALWLSHHTRDKVRASAAALNTTVNDLFRTVLRATARQPEGRPLPPGFGKGIVNAECLLAFDLERIAPAPGFAPSGSPEAPPDAEADLLAVALESALEHADGGTGNWPRIGAEASFLLNDAWLRSNASQAIPTESALRPTPSAGLKKRLPETLANALSAETSGPGFVPPMDIRPQSRAALLHLAAKSVDGLESSARMSQAEAQAILRGDGRDALVADFQHMLDLLARRDGTDLETVRHVAQRTGHILDRAAADELDALELDDRVTLEALVRIKDRPACRVMSDGGIDINDPLLGEWGGKLMVFDIASWTKSVGRIDLDGVHIGTGFVVAPGLVMTNRHVLEGIADEISGPNGHVWDIGRGQATIDFSVSADGSQRHDILKVAMAGKAAIGRLEDLEKLDMALLHVGDAGNLPPPLPLREDADLHANLTVIGYPAAPGTSALIDPQTGSASDEVIRRLRDLFGTAYGLKYVSPGALMSQAGEIPGDTKAWIASHDCTTLGGNSGSPVVSFTANAGVSLLHFSGAPLTANKGHVLDRVRDAGHLDGHGIVWSKRL